MKILVTGSEGLIGRELVSQLEEEGHEVIGFDWEAGVEENILNHTKLNHVFSSFRPEIVYHLAAIVGPQKVLKDVGTTMLVNVHGTHQVVTQSFVYGVEKLIFTSTSEVYGALLRGGWSSDAVREEGPTMIEAPTHPRTCYAISKLAAESLVLDAGGIVARIFNTTGPGQSTEYVLPNMVNRALNGEPIQINGDGLQTRCFCHVQDTARALRLLGEDGYSGIWNVGSDKEITILELAEKVREQIQAVPIEFNPVLPEGSKYRRHPNLEKIKSLGWNADIPLAQIITDVSLGKLGNGSIKI